jgi:hypothetical protein
MRCSQHTTVSHIPLSTEIQELTPEYRQSKLLDSRIGRGLSSSWREPRLFELYFSQRYVSVFVEARFLLSGAMVPLGDQYFL